MSSPTDPRPRIAPDTPAIRWFHPRGDLEHDGWESVVDARLPGWEHTGLRVADLVDGDELPLAPAGVERIVVPLAGSFTVEHREGDEVVTTELHGRPSVFSGPTDVLYLSAASTAALRGTGRVAVAESPTAEVHPTRYIDAAETPIELRGAGTASRQVHNFGTPEALDAARLIVCEVITPAGNRSSFPAHKHDEHVPGHESRLEEIYYFEVAPEGGGFSTEDAFGLFTAASSPAGDLAPDTRVRTGDVALVPFGYHGPADAPPGYDLYYLNVMAGPDPERVWLITDDPAHAHVRDAWLDQAVDPRLPYSPKDGTQR